MTIYTQPNNTTIYNITNEILTKREKTKGIIGIAGNGGSSAEADHFAGELIPIGIPAMAFTNTATITAIANDFSYEQFITYYIHTFHEQLSHLFLLTTSGKSKNILPAIYAAFKYKISSIILTGNTLPPITAMDLRELTIIQFPGNTGEIQEHTLHFIHTFYDTAKQYYKNKN